MRIQKRQFRIGDLAKQLNVEKFVIRFWEKEFAVSTHRSEGGQRFYSQDDLDTFKNIKVLLYEQGFTIAGAKKQLSQNSTDKIMASHKTTIAPEPEAAHAPAQVSPQLLEELRVLKAQLIKLQELL